MKWSFLTDLVYGALKANGQGYNYLVTAERPIHVTASVLGVARTMLLQWMNWKKKDFEI